MSVKHLRLGSLGDKIEAQKAASKSVVQEVVEKVKKAVKKKK